MCAVWQKSFDPQPAIDLINGLHTGGGFRFEAYLQFVSIASIVELNRDIPEVVRYDIITKSIFEAGDGKLLDATTLIDIVTRKENEYLALPLKRYILLTSLSIPFSNKLRTTLILDADIRFSKTTPRNFKRSQKLLARVKTAYDQDMPDGFTVVRVGIEAKGVHEAVDKAIDALDLLRSMWNISLNFQKISRFQDMELNPVNQIILGPIHTIHDELGNQVDENCWYRIDYPRRFHLKGVDIEKIRKGERKIRSKRKIHNYVKEIDVALIRYCQALDHSDLNISFIKLWGVLELLTDSVDEIVIASRVSSRYVETELVRQKAKYLRRYRHQSVHHGREISEILELVFELMHIVETMISFHLNSKSTKMKKAWNTSP